jgi:hypothetical protein
MPVIITNARPALLAGRQRFRTPIQKRLSRDGVVVDSLVAALVDALVRESKLLNHAIRWRIFNIHDRRNSRQLKRSEPMCHKHSSRIGGVSIPPESAQQPIADFYLWLDAKGG